MIRLLPLVWRYMRFNRGKTGILVACLTLTLLLPVAVEALVQHYDEILTARAESTPLVVGAKGNRYDLVLKSLYFDTAYEGAVTMADVEAVEEKGYGRAIPLHLRHTAHRLASDADGDARAPADFASVPVVGTTLAYFAFRGLEITDGTTPLFLGDAVVGAEAARRLDLRPGDAILSDPHAAYDPSRTFQLKMPVVGVLAATGTPDDAAIFVDVKTAWVIDGIGHGHGDVETVADAGAIDEERTTDAAVVATGKVVEYQEITDANRASFHFHGDPDDYPLTAIILVPADDRARTMAAAWYGLSETRDLLEPAAVVSELMGLVFQVKRFFAANFAVVLATTALLVALVLFLSHRLRRAEMETLHKIGCARMTVFGLQASELMILVLVSAALALVGSRLFVALAPRLFEGLF